MIGDSVTCAGSLYICSANDAVVNPSTEFTISFGPLPRWSANFDNGFLVLTYLDSSSTATGTALKTLTFSDLTNPITAITSFDTFGVTNVTASKFSLVDGNLIFDLNGQSGQAQTRIVLGLAQAVPEPATLSIVAASLGIMAMVMRRRKRV